MEEYALRLTVFGNTQLVHIVMIIIIFLLNISLHKTASFDHHLRNFYLYFMHNGVLYRISNATRYALITVLYFVYIILLLNSMIIQ